MWLSIWQERKGWVFILLAENVLLILPPFSPATTSPFYERC
jgi:hypothetical protein